MASSLDAFRRYLGDQGELSDRTIEAYCAFLGHALQLADPVSAVTRIRWDPSRTVPRAALKRWALWSGDKTGMRERLDNLPRHRNTPAPRAPLLPFSDDEWTRMYHGIDASTSDPVMRFCLAMLFAAGGRRVDITRGVERDKLAAALTGDIFWITTKRNKNRAVYCGSDEQGRPTLRPRITPLLQDRRQWTHLYELMVKDWRHMPRSKAVRRACLKVSAACRALARSQKVTLPWGAHRWRHTWATRYYRETGDIKKLTEVMAWSSLDMANRYTHVDSVEDLKQHIAAVLPRGR